MGLRGARLEGKGKDGRVRSFMSCAAHQILFVGSNQEEKDVGKGQVRTGF
jgi:hypothetical protein